jgi:hypothetical protein
MIAIYFYINFVTHLHFCILVMKRGLKKVSSGLSHALDFVVRINRILLRVIIFFSSKIIRVVYLLGVKTHNFGVISFSLMSKLYSIQLRLSHGLDLIRSLCRFCWVRAFEETSMLLRNFCRLLTFYVLIERFLNLIVVLALTALD